MMRPSTYRLHSGDTLHSELHSEHDDGAVLNHVQRLLAEGHPITRVTVVRRYGAAFTPSEKEIWRVSR